MLIYLVGLATMLAVPVFLAVVIWRFLTAYERRGAERFELTTLRERVARLEEEIAELRGSAQQRPHLTTRLPDSPG